MDLADMIKRDLDDPESKKMLADAVSRIQQDSALFETTCYYVLSKQRTQLYILVAIGTLTAINTLMLVALYILTN